MTQTLFFTSKQQQLSEPAKTYHTILRKEEYGTEKSVQAKLKELSDFDKYDVYEVVDRPKDVKLIATRWVLVDKELPDGKIVRKARLCMRGDQESNKDKIIQSDAPTVSKVNIKLLLNEAVRRDWEVGSSDVTRAFLQTSDINRQVYVVPPPEAEVPVGKVWLLKRPAYGLIDAANSFYLNITNGLMKLGCELSRMDNAFYMKFQDNSKPEDDERTLEGLVGAHIDDFLEVGTEKMKTTVLEPLRKQFTFGSHENLPLRYVGFNIDREQDGHMRIDQNHFVENFQIPDMKPLEHIKKSAILSEKYQQIFRSTVSKLNMLATSSRPDITFNVKVLTTLYGKAKKENLQEAIRIIKKVKRVSTNVDIPDLGNVSDWILVAYSDASTKKINAAFSVAGSVIFLVNSRTGRSLPLSWSSKKIERVVNSSFGAETLAVIKLIGQLFHIQQTLKQMYGKKQGDIKTLVLTDARDLYEAVLSVKSPPEKLHTPDVLQIKQAIVVEKIITELRLVSKDRMLADPLTKPNKTGEELMTAMRTGYLQVPGGTKIAPPQQLFSSTWAQIVAGYNESFQPL